MMKIIEANEVFSKISFQEDIDYKTYPYSIYKCPVCTHELKFNMQNFEKYLMNKKSKFSKDIQSEISHYLIQKNVEESNSFIEFSCPQCNISTRLYYTSWAGGRYTAGYKLNFVVIC